MRSSEIRLPAAELPAIEGARAALDCEVHFPPGEIDRLIRSIRGGRGDPKMATSLVNGLAGATGFGENIPVGNDDASFEARATRHG